MSKGTTASTRARGSALAAQRRRATQQLRALAHPLRLRLLEGFAGGRWTTMQVAAKLGEPPTRLYHHVNALERAGILVLVETRQVRGTTEKYFQLASRQIGSVEGERLDDSSRASIARITSALFDEARADLLAAITQSGKLTSKNAPIALRMVLNATPAMLPRVRRRLLAALKQIQRDCKQGKRPSAGKRQWALTVAFAPTVTGKTPTE